MSSSSIQSSASHKLEIQGVSIVVLGNFNPTIFTPTWFSGHNLIPEEEATKADIDIIHKQVAAFSTDWFELKVTADRYALETYDPTKSMPARDLAIGTFQILEHTPMDKFGFNRNLHFSMPSEDAWNALGDYYAPKDSWRGIVTNPGMRTLVIEGKREDCKANQIQVKLEPSRKVKHGIFISVNEHYEIDKEVHTNPTERIEIFLKTLVESWNDFLSYCDVAARHLLDGYR